MPKDIRYLSKRRVNQLIISQTSEVLKCKNRNRDSNIDETGTVGCVLINNIKNNNKIEMT